VFQESRRGSSPSRSAVWRGIHFCRRDYYYSLIRRGLSKALLVVALDLDFDLDVVDSEG
jgi:hypothetical protein